MKASSLSFYLKRPDIAVRKLIVDIKTWFGPEEPWLVKGAVRFCDDFLTKDMTVFEWGSGRSTAWFAERSQKVISVEYNEDWFHKVKEQLQEKNLNNVDLYHVALEHPREEPGQQSYDPVPKYVTAISQHKDLDLVIVDGHYRLECIRHSLERIKPGGYLLVDDTHRIPDWGVPPQWKKVHQSANGFMQTSLWQKPQ